jgi:hypothetical protein
MNECLLPSYKSCYTTYLLAYYEDDFLPYLYDISYKVFSLFDSYDAYHN